MVTVALILASQQRLEIPAGLHTLGEVADVARASGLEVTVAPLEVDRVFAARLVDVDPLVALKAVVSAAGDLEVKSETRDGKTTHTVQVAPSVRAKNDATAARVFNELLTDFRRTLEAVSDEARKLRGLAIDERQPIAKQLQAEYDFIYEEWNKDRSNVGLRRRLLDLKPALLAHTLAGEAWNTFPLEALVAIGSAAPRNFQETENWSLVLSRAPGGAATLRALAEHVPEGEDLRDVDYGFRFGVSPDYVSLAPKVVPILPEAVKDTVSLASATIELFDCLRPSLKYHLDQACAHFTKEPFVLLEPAIPVSARTAVVFSEIDEQVDCISQAALLWAHFAETNAVCELVPAAEFLNEQPEQGQKLSLVDLMKNTNRWTVSDSGGVLVLTCETRAIENTRTPIKAARDAGLLQWRIVDRINVQPIKSIVKYGRAALASGLLWSPRGREMFPGRYYGVFGFELDQATFDVAVADSLGLIDEEFGVKEGTFALSSANSSRLQRAFEYWSKGTTRIEARHPIVPDLLGQATFVVGKMRNREWSGLDVQSQHPLTKSLFGATRFWPNTTTFRS